MRGWRYLQGAEHQPEQVPLEGRVHVAEFLLDERRPVHHAAVQQDAVLMQLEVAREALVAVGDEQEGEQRAWHDRGPPIQKRLVARKLMVRPQHADVRELQEPKERRAEDERKDRALPAEEEREAELEGVVEEGRAEDLVGRRGDRLALEDRLVGWHAEATVDGALGRRTAVRLDRSKQWMAHSDAQDWAALDGAVTSSAVWPALK